MESEGWPQKILWVDLTKGKIKKTDCSQSWGKMYLGARGFNSRRLYDLLEPGIDALSSQNVLIFGVGPLSGTMAPSSGRFTVTAKSPLTDIFGDSNSGEHFGPELRFAGYSQIVFTGKSPTPVYLWIDDDHVELRDAQHLSGKDTWETQERIVEELGDPSIRVACIGPAGENLVRFAGIIHGQKGAAGRCGMGAVNTDPDTGFPLICDLCGGEPKCVEYCPRNALTYERGHAVSNRLRLKRIEKDARSYVKKLGLPAAP